MLILSPFFLKKPMVPKRWSGRDEQESCQAGISPGVLVSTALLVLSCVQPTSCNRRNDE